MRINDKFILDDNGVPRPCRDLIKWARWFEKSQEIRRVADIMVGQKRISTVFLGLNHGFESRVPILWETMVFENDESIDCHRCSGTREQAEAMHACVVAYYEKLEGNRAL